MLHALELARRGVGRVAPNPPVGAVAVRDGTIIAEGWHQEYGGPHAEAQLVRACPDLTAADVYVTLEPCAHHGKTPPCSSALIDARCRRVFYCVADPNPLTAGRGPKELEAAGIEVHVGPCEREGRRLLAPYLHWTRTRRPLVTAKWAMTLDGHIATSSGDSRWISSESMRVHTRGQRSRYDGILVGRGTVEQDDPELLGTDPDAHPLRIVLDSSATIVAERRLVQTIAQAPLLVVAAEDAPEPDGKLEEAGVEILRVPGGAGGLAVGALLDRLGERGITHLLVEGGAQVHGSFLDEGLVDRVQAIVAPKLVGGTGPGPVAGRGVEAMEKALELREPELSRVGNDWLVEGALTDAGLGL